MKQKISITVIIIIVIVVLVVLGDDPNPRKVDEMYISSNSVSNQYIVPAQYTGNEFIDRTGTKYQIPDDIDTEGLKVGKWYMISFWDHATEDTSDDKVTGYRRRLIPPRTIKKSDQ